MWNTTYDIFFLPKITKVQKDKTDFTFRKLVSLIACLFERLWIIAPLVITIKIILHNI